MINRQFISQYYIRGKGIEIGAFHNPFPVNSQMQVTYVDRYSYEHLAKWRDSDHTIQGKEITRVDVIDDGMWLKKFEDNSQDFVLSSHHLEHCWNPLATIENHLRVLKKGGYIFYAVPDMRFTFDKKRPLCLEEQERKVFWEKDEASKILRDQYTEYLIYVDSIPRDEALIKCNEITMKDIKSIDIHWFCWDATRLLRLIAGAPISSNFDIELFSRAGHENFVVLRKL